MIYKERFTEELVSPWRMRKVGVEKSIVEKGKGTWPAEAGTPTSEGSKAGPCCRDRGVLSF